MREEQDAEYQESLRIDKAKDEARKHREKYEARMSKERDDAKTKARMDRLLLEEVLVLLHCCCMI